MARLFSYVAGTTTSHINCTNNSSLKPTTAFTLQAWAYRTGVLEAGGAGIASLWSSGGGAKGYLMWAEPAAANLKFNIEGTSIDSGVVSALNTWQHIVCWWNGTTMKIYVDGVEKASTAKGAFTHSAIDFLIGTYDSVDQTQKTFPGRICEVALWSVALTASEITQLSKKFSPLFIRKSSLAEYWQVRGNAYPEQGLIRGIQGTRISQPSDNGGPTKAEHVPVYYPSTNSLGMGAAIFYPSVTVTPSPATVVALTLGPTVVLGSIVLNNLGTADVVVDTIGPDGILYSSVTITPDPADVVVDTTGPTVIETTITFPPPEPDEMFQTTRWKWWKGYYRPGDAGGICDRCGFEIWLSMLYKEWNGAKVCAKCFEERHPQDRLRGVRDNKPVREPRVPVLDHFVQPGDITPEDL